jgi:hypothetical protein
MQYNKYNFHKYTFCVFNEVEKEAIDGLKLSYQSKSGSSYYFTNDGVFRVSNHWGRAANCRWRLQSKAKNTNQVNRIGYANWSDFYSNNEQGKFFYITVNKENKEVDFQHKDNPNYSTDVVLRNAAATAKRIQLIREVLLEENWSKYLTFDDLDELRNEIIELLIKTDDSFIKIKQKFS